MIKVAYKPFGAGFLILYCIVLYCIVLYCIVLYCIVLYCIVLYCIVFYFVMFCTDEASHYTRLMLFLLLLMEVTDNVYRRHSARIDGGMGLVVNPPQSQVSLVQSEQILMLKE